jgi:VIT1/CCC1 family predicted Fe2+/Mn2+ transporter
MEVGHAQHWSDKLQELGEAVPAEAEHKLRVRARWLAWLARRFSLGSVLPILERGERADVGMYEDEPAALAGMRVDERLHARVLARLSPERSTGGGVARGERWHRGDKSGSLRAAVFGINDGLVSNTSLIMGFAGSGASSRAILLAGIAGLLAGAFSMGAGEFISVSSQTELFRREIDLEQRELEEMPEEEEQELALLYRAKGFAKDEADNAARSIMKNRSVALDTMAREELGLDPEELGSPWKVAASSFAAFAVGAFVVVLPYLIGSGTAAFLVAIGLAVAALVAVGIGIGWLTGRSVFKAAARQLLVGALAAGATYGIGRLIGVRIS